MMNDFYGFKFFPNNINDNNIKLINQLLIDNKTIEFAMYNAKEDIEKMKLFSFSAEKNNIVYHADYSKFDLTKYYTSKEKNFILNNLINEVKNAEKLNASRMVLHIDVSHPIPSSSISQINYFVDKTVVIFEKLYESYPATKNISILIENIFADKEFYKLLIFKLFNKGFNVGFTLDIGHAKVWSSYSLNEWLELAENFIDNNIPVHFHLHTNKGDFDSHTPFFIGKDDDYLNDRISGRNDFYCDDLIQTVISLNNKFKDNPLITAIFEVNIENALKDYSFFTGLNY
jgi:hypothetical protein